MKGVSIPRKKREPAGSDKIGKDKLNRDNPIDLRFPLIFEGSILVNLSDETR